MKACTDTVDMSVLFCGTEFLPPNVHIDLLGEALKLLSAFCLAARWYEFNENKIQSPWGRRGPARLTTATEYSTSRISVTTGRD